MVRLEMVLTFLVMAMCAFAQLVDPTSVRATTSAASSGKVAGATTNAVEAKDPTPEVQPTAAPVVAQSQVVAPPTPACQANTSYRSNPPAVILGNYGEGLTILREAPSYYQVFGGTAAEVRAQIHRCGPTGEFAGQSGYAINWSYALRADETGLCRVAGIKVGVRTSVILPYRAADGSVNAGFDTSWQVFVNGLTSHEYGHVALAEQYGSRLLSSLQNYPAGDCYTMSPGVEVTANGIAAQLNSAQGQYDAATTHGVSQGAIF